MVIDIIKIDVIFQNLADIFKNLETWIVIYKPVAILWLWNNLKDKIWRRNLQLYVFYFVLQYS